MPRSEEWSKKAWKWQEEMLQNLKWSDEKGLFYTLEELMAFGTEWPKMVKAEQGWLGDGESVSFCAGEALVGLGVRSFKRIAACPWEERFNTSTEEIKRRATPKYIIPLTIMGELRHASRVKILNIQPEEQVYPKMEDLWKFRPRFAMPNKTFTVGDVVVKKLETIELVKQVKGCITCYLKAIDQTVAIPMSQRGYFMIVEDGTSYTLQQVYDNFNLPQRVRFESHPAGMHGTSDVLLISETRYDVLIACVTTGLYVGDEEEERRESWGTRDEDFTDISFIFLPKPIDEESPLADTKFFTWQYDPNDPTCQVIMSRASVFELDRFKDMNVVVNANSVTMSTVKQCRAGHVYDYIKVRDFVGDGLVSSTRGKSGSLSATAHTRSKLHSGATTAVENPYSEVPSRTGPKQESFAKKFKHGLKKVRPVHVITTSKRNRSESESCSDKPREPHKVFYTPPQLPRSKVTTLQPPRPRQGSLPPLPNYTYYSKDDMYEQVPNWRKNLAERKISERGRLPLPEEGKEEDEDQGITKPRLLPKLPPKDMHAQQVRKTTKDVIAKLGPVPRPPADLCPVQQPPSRPPQSGGGQAVVQDQTPEVQSQVPATQGQEAVTTGNVTMVQGRAVVAQGQAGSFKGQVAMCQVSAIRGQVAVTQGKSTLTHGHEVITKSKVAVVIQGRTAVVQGRVAVTKGQIQTSSEPGGPRRIKFPPPDGNWILLSELSCNELAMLFKHFNLEKIAEQLKINRVDGEFFENCLESEDFVCSPFFATEFQLKQIERIRNGRY